MKTVRIHLTGWTCSFRYPIFISGTQPTLTVPPYSTLYGLLSAARGLPVTPEQVKVGFVFRSNAKAVDLETLYEISRKGGKPKKGEKQKLWAKMNVCKREFLFEPELFLYIPEPEYAEYFRNPHYPLLLGRQCDLMMVREIKETELKRCETARVGGTMVPFPTDGVYGEIHALPTHFTEDIPRKPQGTRTFCILDNFINVRGDWLRCDEEKGWGVFIYDPSR